MTQMPQLIYGTAWKKERTADLVTQALLTGFRGIDTACQPKHYNEPGVGEAIQRSGISRKDLYIQSKFTPLDGQDPFRIPYDKTAPLPEQVFQSFEISKKNLGVTYLDALILHGPLNTFEKTLTVWKSLEQIYNQQGTLRIGISNCYDLEYLKNLYNSSTIKPTILQNRFYAETDYDHTIRAWCLEKNITYQSFWTLTANPHILQSPLILQAAQTYQKTPEQILFRALIDLGIVPLTGTTNPTHMHQALDSLSLSLPKSLIQSLSNYFKNQKTFDAR